MNDLSFQAKGYFGEKWCNTSLESNLSSLMGSCCTQGRWCRCVRVAINMVLLLQRLKVARPSWEQWDVAEIIYFVLWELSLDKHKRRLPTFCFAILFTLPMRPVGALVHSLSGAQPNLDSAPSAAYQWPHALDWSAKAGCYHLMEQE